MYVSAHNSGNVALDCGDDSNLKRKKETKKKRLKKKRYLKTVHAIDSLCPTVLRDVLKAKTRVPYAYKEGQKSPSGVIFKNCGNTFAN